MANSASVYIVSIDGLPFKKVFTSLRGASDGAGLSYRTVMAAMKEGNYLTTRNDKTIRIIQADIVRQSKGRKNPFPNKD